MIQYPQLTLSSKDWDTPFRLLGVLGGEHGTG